MPREVDAARPSTAGRKRLRIGHLFVDGVTFDGALDEIAAMVEAKRGGVVFTPNVDHVVLAEHDEAFRRAYATATLSLADGMPILWAARLLGSPLPAKVSGSDLVMPLMRRAERMGWRVYILGGGPGVGEKAAERLVSQLPRLIVVGTDAPQVDMRAARATRAPAIERVRAVNPDLVLVALGAPKQELLIAEFSEELRPAVLLGIGASVDFIAGTAQRAPRWMSDAGLEWLYRMAREPRRLWKRYLLRDPEFALVLVREFLRARGKSG